MIDTQFSGRIRMKIDTTANWANALGFIPLKGEIIVYSDYAEMDDGNGGTVYVPNFKVGDGLAYCVDLPFVSDDLRESLSAHVLDRTAHITDEERQFWNNKVRCYMDTISDEEEYLVDGENLIFTVN